ncbi:hypothetical protein GUJ93_ZPchr0013g34039 [Zizania palustris]|uniref:Uncharacterized protein n=1 Tax=Zizania palustris TaxID=103762 RepID=A0A8J5WUZ4_ZIZPA|nr:hypothetical protein GUJ93_ZPchr0013g34039 [Zizania palustris]
MVMIAPSAELVQVIAELQKAVPSVSVQLGLALMPSTLSSFPYGAIGFLITSSPLLVAVAKAQAEGGNWTWWLDTEGGATGEKGDTATGQTLAELPLPRAASDFERATRETDRAPLTVEVQSRVKPLCATTPDEAAFLKIHNGALGPVARSFPNSTDDDGVELAPQSLPLPADKDGTEPIEDEGYVGDVNRDQEGENNPPRDRNGRRHHGHHGCTADRHAQRLEDPLQTRPRLLCCHESAWRKREVCWSRTSLLSLAQWTSSTGRSRRGRVGLPAIYGSSLRGLLSVELGPDVVSSFMKTPKSYPLFLKAVVGVPTPYPQGARRAHRGPGAAQIWRREARSSAEWCAASRAWCTSGAARSCAARRAGAAGREHKELPWAAHGELLWAAHGELLWVAHGEVLCGVERPGASFARGGHVQSRRGERGGGKRGRNGGW